MSAAGTATGARKPNGAALPAWGQSELQDIRVKPAPLARAAFYGIAGEFVRIVEPHSESDPAALLVQFLVAAGIFLGRTAYHLVESSRHFTNLFAIICGDSSKARKGTSWGRVRAVFAQTDAEFFANCFPSGLSSGEGLIFHVRDPVSEIRFGKGGTEGKKVLVDDGVKDKRICIVESEFSRTLKVAGGDTNILSAVIRDAYDTGDLDNLTKNNRNKATDAHIAIIGHITKDEVIRLLTNTEAANGFGNRFLWVWASRSKSLPHGGNLAADALDGIRQGLLDAEANMYPDMPSIDFSAKAKDLWEERYEDLSAGKPGLTGAL
jgi:hypothetical protein